MPRPPQETSIDVSVLIHEAYSTFGKLTNSGIERLRLKHRLKVSSHQRGAGTLSRSGQVKVGGGLGVHFLVVWLRGIYDRGRHNLALKGLIPSIISLVIVVIASCLFVFHDFSRVSVALNMVMIFWCTDV